MSPLTLHVFFFFSFFVNEQEHCVVHYDYFTMVYYSGFALQSAYCFHSVFKWNGPDLRSHLFVVWIC